MSARRQDLEIVKDTSQLYELSLAIGTSLDLSENCEGFLKILLARKNLDYAAVWLKTPQHFERAESEGYALAYAMPTSRVDVQYLSATHPVVAGLLDAEGCYSVASDDPAFRIISTERNVAQGAYAVFSLGDLGLLKLYSSRRRRPFEARWLNQLRNVLAKFTVSLQGCLAHEQLRSEMRERARTNEQLQAATSRLSALIENLQAGILVEDDHRRVALANQGFCDLFSIPLSPDALIGSDCSAALQQSKDFFLEPEAFVDRTEKLLTAQQVVVGEEWTLVDGRTFARDYIPIVLDGTYRGHLWQYRDVTEQKQAHDALRRAEQRYRELFEEAPVMYVITESRDQNPYIVDCNGLFLDTLGYIREEVLERPLADFYTPESVDRLLEQGGYRRALETASMAEERQLLARDGRIIETLLLTRPEADAEGRIGGTRVTFVDITEQKRAELARSESETRYKQLVEHANDFIYRADCTWRLTYVNAVALRVLGYSEAQIMGESFLALVPESHRGETLAFYEKQLDEKVQNTYHELPVRTVEGKTIWIGQNVQLVWQDEEVAGVQAVARDITERRQAMTALEESEARKHAIFATALDCIITVDEAGRVLEFNAAAEAVFGYRREEIIGQPMVDHIVPAHLREAHRRGMARYQDTGAVQVLGQRIEITALHADGTEFPVELAITPIRLGDREIFTAYLRDITERKQAEQALRASNTLLQVISRIQSHFIADLDPHALFEELLTELLTITDSEYGFIGEVRYEADGHPYLKTFALTNIAWDEATRTFYDENVPQGLEFRNLDTLFGAALKTGAVVIANEPANDPRSGGLPPGHPPLNAFLGIPFSRGDHLIGMVGIANRPGGYDMHLVAYLEPFLATCTNIIEAWHTEIERRKAEEALRLSKDKLELQTVQLQQIVRELDQARHVAEQSMKAREQFLANMSHEIRTPMNAILGMSHLLRQTQPTEEQQKYLAAIARSSETLLALINDILDIAKIESGKITFEEVPFRPNKITQHLMEMVQFDAQENGLTLAVHLPKDLPDVLIGDSVRLNQVLLNLISNAIKFTEAGSVVVTVRIVARHADQIAVQFEVADTGIGISEEHLEQIFESFTQARSDTTRKYGGTGLGLAIVKELVERQGGTVAVESTVGEGSVFTVTLPFRIGSKAVLGPEEHIRLDVDSIDLGKARILLVEDNELNQLVARNMLMQWGAQVDVAENGRVALERLRQAVYDLVLMDIQMPEMDGYEATRCIREDLRLSAQELPILALTASVLIDHREHMEAAGMNDVILKPFDPHDLHRRVAHHLGRCGPSADQAPRLDSTGYVDLAFLKANALGNEAFIPRMIDLFLSQTPDFLRRLQQALAEADWPQVTFIAHKMKSSAGMLGISALEAALRTIETHAAETVRLDELPRLIEDVACLCEGAMEELTRVRQDFEAGSQPVSTT